MNLTGDQRYFLTILGQTGFVRPDQVLPLLRINEPGKESGHAEAMLRRLRYLGLLARPTEGLVCLPEEPPKKKRTSRKKADKQEESAYRPAWRTRPPARAYPRPTGWTRRPGTVLPTRWM